MRVLIISQYFWPEYFRINDLVKYLMQSNYQVDVLTGIPNYPEGKIYKDYKLNKNKYSNYYGANVYRVPIYLRRNSNKLNLFINYITYIISSVVFGYFILRKKKYDIIFCFATSPTTSALPGIFFSKVKKCKCFLWVLDIWPDILLELKIVRNIYLYNIIRKIVYFIYKRYDYIFAQSPSFKKELLKYNNNVDYIPSWSENFNNILIESSFTKKYKNDTSLKIVFTGNIGEAQNFNNIIKCAELLKSEKDIKWIIVGAGRELENLKKICIEKKINNFIFEGQKSNEEIKSYHDIADVLLISLVAGKMISGTIPGKLQTYLSTNKYILGFIEGETKRIINESKAGVCVDPTRPDLLKDKIIFIKNNRHILEIPFLKKLGTKYLNQHFNKEFILQKIDSEFCSVYNGYDKIRLINNVENIPFNQNFSLSGLNLAFLGFLALKRISFKEHIYFWPDGIFHKRFFKFSNKKISGRELLSKINLPFYIKNIYILGNATENSKEYLKNKFRKNIIHIHLPYGDLNKIYKKCPKNFKAEDLIILTLPTPLQEQISQLISENNSFFKILCIGGALAMASGDETPVPKYLDNLGLEFLWRLRNETYRRSKRLFITLFVYLFYETSSNFFNIRSEIFEKKI